MEAHVHWYYPKITLATQFNIAFADITDFVSFGSESAVAEEELGRNIKDDEGNNSLTR